MNKASLIFALILTCTHVNGQELLTFQSALSKTLESNYDIRLTEIDVEVAENNAQRSANGYLPTLSGIGGYNWTFYEGTNTLIQGEQNFDANSSYSYNAGLTLSYSIFDGFGRKFRYQQSEGNRKLTELQLKALTENTVLQLSLVYHELARLQQQTTSLDSTLVISKQRLQRATYGYEYGQSTQLDVLNAQVDLDTDSINWLNSRQQLENSKRNLNLIMGVPIQTEYEIQNEVLLRENFVPEEVAQIAQNRSTSMLTAVQQKEVSELVLGVNKSVWYPNIGANAGYQYRGSDDPNGAFLIGSNSFGPTAGLNLTWNLFNGNNSTKLKNAKLQLERSELDLQRRKEQVTTDALNACGAYQNSLYVLEASENIVGTARNNYDRSSESFKLGQISSIEFRQAQLNLLNAELQLSRALYDAKNNELQVLALMGELVN